MGWTDPRMPQFGKTGFEDVPTDVLRNLWLVKFGGRVVSMDDVHALSEDDISEVSRELLNRKQLRHESLERPDIMERQYFYILEKEDGNN
jgi:hypothetical protein